MASKFRLDYDAEEGLLFLCNQNKKIEKAQFSFTVKKGATIVKVALPIEKERVPAAIAIPNMRYKRPILAHVR